jgi:hypothetical protein
MRFILDSLLVVALLKVFGLSGNIPVIATASTLWTLYAVCRFRAYQRGRHALRQLQQSQAGLQAAAKSLGEAFRTAGTAFAQVSETAKRITMVSESAISTKPGVIN